MKQTIGIFIHDPWCETDCGLAMAEYFSKYFNVKTIGLEDLTHDSLATLDVLAFPGGMGDSDDFYTVFTAEHINSVRNYVAAGGKYFGICMGAYWAGPDYFNLTVNLKVEQYIAQPTTNVFTDGPTATMVAWDNIPYNMYFYDGCAILGEDMSVVSRYANGDAMAAIQGNVGMVGCHPESQEWWFTNVGMDAELYNPKHGELMCNFVQRLLRND
jgi:glutamine amidotransferase-like uncharacterized protein